MGAFARALDAAPEARIGAPSKLDQIRQSFDDEARAEFDEALAVESPARIHRALRELGFDVAYDTVAKWCRRARRG